MRENKELVSFSFVDMLETLAPVLGQISVAYEGQRNVKSCEKECSLIRQLSELILYSSGIVLLKTQYAAFYDIILQKSSLAFSHDEIAKELGVPKVIVDTFILYSMLNRQGERN